MIKITNAPVEPGEIFRMVQQPEYGAISLFCGLVRDHHGDYRTRYLEYEAYVPMAERVMEDIVLSARERWPLGPVAVVHRIGHIDIGDTVVVIAIASEHRKEGLAAVQFIIDQLKERVPIWKKEVGPDGSWWVEETNWAKDV